MVQQRASGDRKVGKKPGSNQEYAKRRSGKSNFSKVSAVDDSEKEPGWFAARVMWTPTGAAHVDLALRLNVVGTSKS